MEKKVTIIVRSKNEAHWLRHLFRFLKVQTYKNFEVVLVDNLSSDESVEIAKANSANVVLIKEYRPGRALNLGCQESSGDYLVLLSAHCLPVEKTWLEILVSELEKFSKEGCAGVFGRQVPTDISSEQAVRDLTITFGPEARNQYIDPFFHNANAIILKSIWEKIPFDDHATNIEDRIWAAQVLKMGHFIRYSPAPAVAHYHGIHQDNLSSRMISTANVVRHYNFTDLIPIKHLFENVCIVFSNNASEEILKNTIQVISEAKRQGLFKYIVLVGLNNTLPDGADTFIDLKYEKSTEGSYFYLAPEIKNFLKSNRIVFDNAFILDTSYINRKISTLHEMYSEFLKIDADVVMASYRETRNYLIVSKNSTAVADRQFLFSSQNQSTNTLMIKCAGFCTIIKAKTMASISKNTSFEVKFWELSDHQETKQIIEYNRNKL